MEYLIKEGYKRNFVKFQFQNKKFSEYRANLRAFSPNFVGQIWKFFKNACQQFFLKFWWECKEPLPSFNEGTCIFFIFMLKQKISW